MAWSLLDALVLEILTGVVAAAEDALVPADQDRIGQALGNLLSNARRYGGPTIGIAARIDDTGAALIRVWDDGPGIAPEYRERLFDTFIRAHDIPGLRSGIGRAVCRAVARAHGGDVVVEDGPQTSFLLTVPGARHDSPQASGGAADAVDKGRDELADVGSH